MTYMETQRIDIADLDTLEYNAVHGEETVSMPVTPIPAMPEEVASGPAWQLFQYGRSYALAFYTPKGRFEVLIPSTLGMDIHLKYKKLEQEP